MIELTDTHCHLTFEQLSSDIDALLDRSRQANVTRWITIGTEPTENRAVVELANKYDNMYSAVGIHPHFAKETIAKDIEELKTLANDPTVVAIGEIGLDFHYDFSPVQEQKQLFAEQLQIAKELHKPVVIHSREAFDETIKIVEQDGQGIEKIVFHCFGYGPDEAKYIIDKGWHISFTGSVTFRGKRSDITREAAKVVPLDRLMIETDCPYMSPVPMRKQKVNEPALMIHTANFLAELKEIDLEEFARQVNNTSLEFFNIS